MIQFAFWILGEYGYVSTQHTDTDIMKEIQKYIQDIEGSYKSTEFRNLVFMIFFRRLFANIRSTSN